MAVKLMGKGNRGWSWWVVGTRCENVCAEARFQLAHEARSYADWLGVVVVCLSLAARVGRSGRLEG